MIELGVINNLKILRHTPPGLFLGDEEDNEVLLPNRYVPESYEIDDFIDVFVYLDNEERIVSVTDVPYIQRNNFALLRCNEVTSFGAFLDWGLVKELFCPFKEMAFKMKKGDWYLVHCYLDDETNRLLASSKTNRFLDNKTLTVEIESEKGVETKTYHKVLISVGRKPNTGLLKVENADINVNDRGYIEVDEYQRTSQKNIFAIGDIVGNPMLAHKATHEGKVAAEVASGHPAVMDPKAIPSVVYTDPEVAWTGLTETEAKKDKIPYEKGEFPWAASGKAQILNASQGKTKILFDPETKQVLGAGIVGPSAGDLICEAALAIEMGSDAEDIGLTVHPHPTLGETFAAAAEVYLGTMTDLYTPSK